MTVLSLFDGMSCGQLALHRAGIPFDYYLASEIDKYAINITQKNFPDTLQIGDVTKIQTAKLPWIDLLIGGSPCQGFSSSGKGLNFDDPRSALFFHYIRTLKAVRKVNPKVKFLLENVKMRKEWEAIITKYMGVEPVEINSALVSAQTRKRLYWTNINDGNIPQPKDKGILLKHICFDEVDEKYYLSAEAINRLKIINQRAKRNGLGFSDCKVNGENKYPCIDASYAKGPDGKRGVYMGAAINKRKGNNTLEKNGNEKSYALLTDPSRNRNLIVKEATKKGFVEIELGGFVDIGFPGSTTRRGRNMKDKSNALITSSGTAFAQYTHTGQLRMLTPVECERLQTVPDNYTENVSDSQRYKMLGNGWNIDTIAHILSYLKIGGGTVKVK